MTYNAIITKVVNVRDHSNADLLNIGTAAGHQVVIDKNTKEGTLGVLFPEGGCLSELMCKENNLFRQPQLNRDPTVKAGFFENNSRVRAMKLRGEKSEGFWTTLDTLTWTGVNISQLKEGEEFTKLKDCLVCEKYYTKATKTAMKNGKPGEQKKRPIADTFPTFKKHFSTSHLRSSIGTIPGDAVIYITEKCHGCVDKDTIIDTLEEGKIRIKEIVEQKKKLHIKTLNTETNEIEYALIDNWYFYPNDEDWYEIELENGQRIEITGNNPIWLPKEKCYRRVDELVGEEVLLID